MYVAVYCDIMMAMADRPSEQRDINPSHQIRVCYAQCTYSIYELPSCAPNKQNSIHNIYDAAHDASVLCLGRNTNEKKNTIFKSLKIAGELRLTF